jgi:hypothetical protein
VRLVWILVLKKREREVSIRFVALRNDYVRLVSDLKL